MNTDTQTTQQPSSLFSTLINMFTEPSKAYEAIKLRGAGWFPLLLVILSSCATFFYYFQAVDFEWLIDKMFAKIPNAADRESAANMMSRDMMQYGAMGSIVIMLPLFTAIMALYFLIVCKIKKLDFGFGKWFSFVAWSNLPVLVLLPLGIMQVLLSNQGQLTAEQLNPTTLNQLFFHIEAGKPWQAMMDSISLPMVWSTILMVIGYQQWAKTSRGNAIAIVLAPSVVIYGIWAIYSLMSK